MTRFKQTYQTLGLGLLLTLPLSLPAKSSATLPLDEIRNFVDVYNAIKHEYVEEKEGKTLIDFAIEGMLNGLDPHSVYLKKDDLQNFNDATSGSYLGFGIQLEIIHGQLFVVSPISDSPAEKAGIKPNDRIVKINGTVIDNISMNDVDKLLKDQDKVTFTITNPGDKTKAIELTRTTINLPSVTDKILDNDYGYIRISQFQNKTAKHFAIALDKLTNKDIKGLVIDLRNNPGGLVHVATDIADHFIDAGLIVSTKNPNTGSEEKVHAQKDNTDAKKLPLVILINKGSASASELLAGALQSHKRAVIVGQPSFGKGSVQNLIPLSNGDAIKLTTARYYTPSGESIQAKGIIPDITLSQLAVDDKELNLLSYGERNIAGHLSASDEDTDTTSDPQSSPADKPTKDKNPTKQTTLSATELAKNDLQLFEALNVLKVLTLKR